MLTYPPKKKICGHVCPKRPGGRRLSSMERVLLHWWSAPFSDKLQCLFYGRRLNCFRYGHHFGPVVLDGHPSVLEGHRVTLFCINHRPSRHDAHGIRAPIRCRQVWRVKLSLIKRQTLQTDNSNTRN